MQSLVSSAQNFEDLMLWRALANVKHGSYIDVGAQDPSLDSVSKLFYDQGWRGINVEPTPHYADLLRRDRPDEVIVQAAVGAKSGVLNFYEFPDTGLSTADRTIAEQHVEKGYRVKEIVVPCVTLDEIFRGQSGKDVHWLKIDVEGGEQEVLEGWVRSRKRPWIVVIESTYPMTQVETQHQWERLILAKGYKFAYFDGLSRFYVANGHDDLLGAFSSGPNVFDVMFHGFSLSATTPFCGGLHSQILTLKEQHEHLRQETERQLAVGKQESVSQLAQMEQQFSQQRAQMENDHREQRENAQREWAGREQALIADWTQREKAQSELVDKIRDDLENLQRASLQREQDFAAHLQTFQQQATQQALLLERSFREQNEAQQRIHANRERELLEQLSLAESGLHRIELEREEQEAAHRELLGKLSSESDARLAAQERSNQMAIKAIAHKHLSRERVLNDELLKAQQELSVLKLDHARHDEARLELMNRLRNDVEANLRASVEREREFAALQSGIQQKTEQQLRLQGEIFQEREKNLLTSIAAVQQEILLMRKSFAWRITAPIRALTSFVYGNSRAQRLHNVGGDGKFTSANVRELSLDNINVVDRTTMNNAAPQTIASAVSNNTYSPLTLTESRMSSSLRNVAQSEPTIDKLLEKHDGAFVEAVYETLLGRAPDPDGFDHYVGRLRAGDSKVQLIAQIAESAEARRRKTELAGLHELIAKHKRDSHWLWGRFFRDRHQEQQVRRLENQLGLMSMEMSRFSAELKARVATIEEPIRQSHVALEVELSRATRETSRLASEMAARIANVERPIADIRQLLNTELGRITAELEKIKPKLPPPSKNVKEYDEAIKPITVSIDRSVPPRFSVIVLQFNKSELTVNCVRSLLRHSNLNEVEVVVVDNGSAPEHVANLRNEFGNQIVIVEVGTNRYFGEGNNIGVDHASGELIVFMNNDVVVTEHWLDKLEMNLKGDVEVVGPAFFFPDGRVQECGGYIKENGDSIQQFRGEDKKRLPQAPFECDYISAAAILLRKEMFLKVGGFDLCYEPAYYEDVDLCLKIASYGGRVVCDPSVTIFHNENATSSDPSLGLRLVNDVVDTNKTKFVDRWRVFLTDRINSPVESQKIPGTAMSPVRSGMSRQPETMKRAILFSPYPMTPGGGEKYLLTIAQELSKTYLTTLAFEHSYSTSRLRQLEGYLNLDLSSISLMDFSSAQSQSWDVAFVLGNSIAPPFQKLSPTSFYICQFPFDRQHYLSKPLPYSDAYRYLCYSEFVKDHIIEGRAMQAGKVTVLEPVIHAYARAAIKEKLIVSVGRFFAGGHCKNQKLLIEAFGRLVAGGQLAGWKLVLIGSTRPEHEHRMYYRQCREAAEGLNVEIIPDASFEVLSDIYARAALYWHGAGIGIDPGETPEKLEHFGITPLEAASAGCHVFVPAAGGPREIAERAPGNFYVYESIDELVEITEVLCKTLSFENDPLKPDMDRFIASFSIDAFGKRLRKTISQVSQDNSCDLTTVVGSRDHRVRWVGWSDDENGLRWSSGHESRIEFLWGEQAGKSCWITIRFHTLGAQRIRIQLNGVALLDTRVSGQNQEVVFEVKGLNAGFNTLFFSFPDAHQPGGGDGRLLAMRFDSLLFSGEAKGQAVSSSRAPEQVFINRKNPEQTRETHKGLVQ